MEHFLDGSAPFKGFVKLIEKRIFEFVTFLNLVNVPMS